MRLKESSISWRNWQPSFPLRRPQQQLPFLSLNQPACCRRLNRKNYPMSFIQNALKLCHQVPRMLSRAAPIIFANEYTKDHIFELRINIWRHDSSSHLFTRLLIYLSFLFWSVYLLIDWLIDWFILGLWQGYFVDNRALRGKSAGSKWLIDVNMTFQSRDQFTAMGRDEIGSFTFENGNITGTWSRQCTWANQKRCVFATT